MGKIGIEAIVFLLGVLAVYRRFGKITATLLAVIKVLNSTYVHSDSPQKNHFK